MNEKKHEKFEEKVYSFIIKYFEIMTYFKTHSHNRSGALTFILECMERLEKVGDENIIDNSLVLFTHYLGDGIFMDTYNTFGAPLGELANGDKKILNMILEQEFITSQGG